MSSTSSTSNNSSTQAHYVKNQLFLNKAPKILKINAIFIVSMIVAFYIISIYNLAVFLEKHDEISGRLEAFEEISERNSNIRAAMLDMKMM